MKKIPTLFKRNPENMKHVLPDVTPGCEWVLAGEGVATRKYDGTCVRLADNGIWWARREVKPEKQPPPGWIFVETDRATGKSMGWQPIEDSSFAKFHAEALVVGPPLNMSGYPHFDPGTYELVGPKINRNPEPEQYAYHTLIPHGRDLLSDTPRDFDGLRAWLFDHEFEGIVWHHPDGRMVKLKRRDFGS